MQVQELMRSWLAKIAAGLVVLIVLGFISFIVFRIGWVDSVNNYQLAYRYDLLGPNRGKITILKNADGSLKRGWIITAPIITKVHTIDLRPMQVQINANNRVLNAKLVQFDPKGAELFIAWHGRKDYEGPGGSSSGIGVISTGNFYQILLSYAYDGKEYPFLKILRELKPEEKSSPLDQKYNELQLQQSALPDSSSSNK